MNSKERMRSAMGLGRPDRVPVMCQMSIGHMLLQTGVSPVEFWLDGGTFVQGLLDLRALYGFDGILVSLHGHGDGWRRDIVEWTRGGEEEIVRWRDGGKTVFPRDDLPRHYPAAESGPPPIAGFDPGSLPEEIGRIPVSQGLHFALDPAHRYDAVAEVVRRAGREFSIHGEVTSPLDYFLDLFGFAEGFLALAEEPERSKAVLDRFAGGVAAIARDLASLGVDAVKISSPYAGAGFLSPRHYRDYVLPAERRIAQAGREAGVFVYTHTCGRIGDRLEMMAETGVSGLECLDPPPLGNVELEDAKSRIGERLFIKGNIDPVNVLLRGTDEDVERDVGRRLAVGGRGGGFILSTACSIAPRTDRGRVKRLAERAAEDIL